MSICIIWLGRNEVMTTSLCHINQRDENIWFNFPPGTTSLIRLENRKNNRKLIFESCCKIQKLPVSPYLQSHNLITYQTLKIQVFEKESTEP